MVSPVSKTGDRKDRSNYRPISVLPVVSIFFEKLVFSQVYGYFMKENMFSDHQSGFREVDSFYFTANNGLLTTLWQRRRKQSRVGGGGSISGTLFYFGKQAKILNLENRLSLLHL